MKVDIHISKEIQACAAFCEKGHACVLKQEKPLCKVVFCVNCKILGILCQEESPCNYKHTEDERTYCLCPARLEIFRKYNI